MTLIFLLLIEVVLFFMSYKSSGNDLTAPANFSIFMIIIATFFAIIGSNLWNIEFSFTAMLYLALGILAMLMGQGTASLFSPKSRCLNHIYSDSLNHEFFERIEIIKGKVVTVDVIVILLTCLYALDVLKAGTALGVSGLSSISAVRYSDVSGTNTLIRQGIKVVMAVSYVDSFVVAHNLCVKWRKKDFLHCLSLICACVCSLFTGVRTEILRVFLALFVLYYFNQKEKRGWNRSVSGKLLKKFLPILCLLAIAFSLMKTVVKSSDLPINEAFTFFEYIAYYIGSPILVFGIKEGMGFESFTGDLFGENTLNSFYENLAEWGFIPSQYTKIYSTNVYISKAESVTANVDTIFGGLIIDFGIAGMLIFTFVLYYMLSRYYYKKVKYMHIKGNSFTYISYAFIFYLPAMSYYSNVFGQYISMYFILTYAMIFCVYFYYFRFKHTGPAQFALTKNGKETWN